MPRTKKAPGQAVDRRNGRRMVLDGDHRAALGWFVLPERRPAWPASVLSALEALRGDSVADLLTAVDGPVIVRWLDSLARAEVCMRRADRQPVVRGGNGQVTEHPSYGTAKAALAEVARCEAQLGVGALNRNKLGVTFAAAAKSLADLNREYGPEGGDDDDEPDPRAIPGSVER